MFLLTGPGRREQPKRVGSINDDDAAPSGLCQNAWLLPMLRRKQRPNSIGTQADSPSLQRRALDALVLSSRTLADLQFIGASYVGPLEARPSRVTCRTGKPSTQTSDRHTRHFP